MVRTGCVRVFRNSPETKQAQDTTYLLLFPAQSPMDPVPLFSFLLAAAEYKEEHLMLHPERNQNILPSYPEGSGAA